MNAKDKVPVLWHLANGNSDELTELDRDEIVESILSSLEELHTDVSRAEWNDTLLAEAVGYAIGLLLTENQEVPAVELERALICRWIATGHTVDLITPSSRTKLEVLGMAL